MSAASSNREPILAEVERIRQIYSQVLGQRTRKVELLGRKCEARILYTFLGFEVKMGRKRLTCPDAVSARYLRLFAEVGMEEICIPYDPTHTGLVLSGLEPALDRIKDLLLHGGLDEKAHKRAVQRAYKSIRETLERVWLEHHKSSLE